MLCKLTCLARCLLAGCPHSVWKLISVSFQRVLLVISWTLQRVLGNLPQAMICLWAASDSLRVFPSFSGSSPLSPHPENASVFPAEDAVPGYAELQVLQVPEWHWVLSSGRRWGERTAALSLILCFWSPQAHKDPWTLLLDPLWGLWYVQRAWSGASACRLVPLFSLFLPLPRSRLLSAPS